MTPVPALNADPPAARRHSAAACKYCRTREDPVRLVPPAGGDAMYVCPRCLRSLLLRKADLSHRRNELLLEAWAEENGLQVWCSQDVAYALPPAKLANA